MDMFIVSCQQSAQSNQAAEAEVSLRKVIESSHSISREAASHQHKANVRFQALLLKDALRLMLPESHRLVMAAFRCELVHIHFNISASVIHSSQLRRLFTDFKCDTETDDGFRNAVSLNES